MSNTHKVVWVEGMFLQPQHFQQQQRYHQAELVQVLQALQPHGWGFTALNIDSGQLDCGWIALTKCAGILPDGSLFALNEDELAVLRYPVPEASRDLHVVLALAIKRPLSADTELAASVDSMARHRLIEAEVVDDNADGSGVSTLQLGQLNLKLMCEKDVSASHVFLRIARVLERNSGGQIVLDEQFIAPVMAWRCSSQLAAHVDNIIACLRQRGSSLASNLGVSGLGGVSEVQYFLMLQAINRAELMLVHLTSQGAQHPELLYRQLITLIGELSMFFEAEKRPKHYPTYRHDRLAESFSPVIQDLQHALSALSGTDVIPLSLKTGERGLRFTPVIDTALCNSARFILAARAEMPDEDLRRVFPTCLKIGPAERMQDLVDLQLLGFSVRALPAAPRELPYYAGFNYFELEKGHPLWAELVGSSRFGLHVAGAFPDLQLAFWAIKDPQ